MAAQESLAQILQRFRGKSEALGRISSGGQLQRLQASLEPYETLPAALRQIQRRVAIKLRPVIISVLAQAYTASGVGRISGDLWRATVEQVSVEIYSDAIVVRMPKGLAANVYARAGAFKFGSVTNKVFKSTYTDLITGETKSYKSGKGGLFGERAKRSLKAQVFKGVAKGKKTLSAANSGSVIVKAPKHGFFSLDAGVERIEAAYQQFYQEEVTAHLRRRKAA